jgi:hypothetical protein
VSPVSITAPDDCFFCDPAPQVSIDASQLQITVFCESTNPSGSENDWVEDRMHSAVNKLTARIGMALEEQPKGEA